MSRPTLKTNCVANNYSDKNQRIAEFGRRDGRAGGLLSIRETESGLDISVYRTDGPVRVASNEASAYLAALRAVLPYAESRLEDMEESQEELDAGDTKHDADTIEESRQCLHKARAAFEAAKAALVLAGEPY